MFPSILDQGFVDVTDPTRLHAELWGDFFSKVISCWLPLLMSTVLVGRDLLGSSIQCFPLDLIHVPVQPENGTYIPDGNSSSNAFSGISVYTRQLFEFVNTYCGVNNSFPEDTVFTYQFFAMMLVVQAGLMYVPFLIWKLTKSREIICIVRFIAHDMEVLYDRFRKQNIQDQSRGPGTGIQENPQIQAERETVVYGQEELVEAEKQWRVDCTMYKWYVMKQVMSIFASVAFLIFHRCQLKSTNNIPDNFSCSVEGKFSVICTVPAAKVHKFIWITNMYLLGINVLLILIHLFVLYTFAEDYPFAEIGIKKKSQPQAIQDAACQNIQSIKESKSQGAEGHSIEETEIDIEGNKPTEAQPLTKKAQSANDPNESKQVQVRLKNFNDSCLIHAFFKANIESVEKYNYVKTLLKVAPKRPDTQRPRQL